MDSTSPPSLFHTHTHTRTTTSHAVSPVFFRYPSLTDFAHTLLDGTKAATVGEWTVKFGVKETFEHGQGYAELKLTTY